MKNHIHIKQVLLFLLAVILPCFILVFSTFYMIDQEKELSQRRLLEERQRAALDIGRRLLIRLETLKLLERQAMANMPQSQTSAYSANPEVVLRCQVKEDRIIFPWEMDPRTAEAKRLLNEEGYLQLMARAEQEEFINKNYGRAAEYYREISKTAPAPIQKEYARLMLARSLARSNRLAEAQRQYLQLLTHSSWIGDENGIPLFLYAARGLLAGRENQAEILDRLQSEFALQRWFSLAEAFMARDVLDAALPEIDETALTAEADALKRNIENRIRILEQALAIRQDFPGLIRIFAQGDREEKGNSVWISWDQAPWLISLSRLDQEAGYMLVAVDQQEALASLKSENGFTEVFSHDFFLTQNAGTEGDYLGPNFPGLKAVFTSFGASNQKGGQDVRHNFYLLALILILSITFFSAYLLWRDIRRDIKMTELRSQFVSSVSHELKTPLTAIRMFAETLRMGRAKDAKTRDEYLDTIVSESQRLTRLLNNVLDFSKIEKGKRIYRLEPASLKEIVLAASRAMEYPLSQQGFKLRIQADENLPEACVDRDAIEQAILNLLHNAMKYSGQSRNIDLSLQKIDGQALIQVADRGIGIAPHEKMRIFEKYYRIPSSDNERLPGTGLGLTLVSHIVSAHGGRIEVESSPGQGSTFSIYLPLGKKS